VALTHDAVSALLRLPVLSGLDITGCGRISSMDKMRLVRTQSLASAPQCLSPSRIMLEGRDEAHEMRYLV